MAKGNANAGGPAIRGVAGGMPNPNASPIGASNQQEVLAKLIASLGNRGNGMAGGSALAGAGAMPMPMTSSGPVPLINSGPPILSGPMSRPSLGAASGDISMPLPQLGSASGYAGLTNNAPIAIPDRGKLAGNMKPTGEAPAIGPSDENQFVKRMLSARQG